MFVLEMGLLRNLKESFSWPLALVFVGIGLVSALFVHTLGVEFDRRGFVESDDGLRLEYELQGQGPPLVAVSGGPGSSHHGFHPYLGRLSRQATVIYFDPRGRGDSDPAPGYQVADDVRDLDSLRSGLGLSAVDVLGVSYGAHLAVCYALEHPGEVRYLVLVSPIVGRQAWADHLELLLEAPGMKELLSSIRERRGEVVLSHRDTRERILRALLPLYWCDPTAVGAITSLFGRRHHVARYNYDVYEAIVGRPFGELNGDLAGSDVGDRLGEIEAPTLIIHGGCDGVLPTDHVDWLVGRLPQARKHLFPGSGHSPFVDEPSLFAERVGEFLAQPSSQ